MFDAEIKKITDVIQAFCEERGLSESGRIQWSPIPFAGEWGISTSFFQIAALEARSGKTPEGISVQLRAQQIAAEIALRIGALTGVSRIETTRGYLNLFYSTSDYAAQVIRDVMDKGDHYGQGNPKHERVMVEYAQPNTHHSFHMGHFRNAILGEVLSRLVEFAGYPTMRASYPGDIGLGVITILWMYMKFYQGQEPEGVHERGQWLLKLYVEANRLLEAKDDENS